MKMKNRAYYADTIEFCVKAVSLVLFAIDFTLLAIWLA